MPPSPQRPGLALRSQRSGQVQAEVTGRASGRGLRQIQEVSVLPEGGRPREESELIHTGAAASPPGLVGPKQNTAKPTALGRGLSPRAGPAPWFWGCF